MITNGQISDLPSTVEAIVEAADSPMSIIIVGVGEKDFKKMEGLDEVHTIIKNGEKRQMARDIV